ncbi:hypothetical protein RYX36_026430 [Vicia faba]
MQRGRDGGRDEENMEGKLKQWREMARTTLDFSSTFQRLHPTPIIIIPSSSLTKNPNNHHYSPTSFFITNIIIFHHTFLYHDDHKNHSKLTQEQQAQEDYKDKEGNPR